MVKSVMISPPDRPSPPKRPSGWPTPFLLAKEALDPVFQAGGFRPGGVDHDGGQDGHAIAEYYGRGERLRLVWEGHEKVLWLEAARERDAQIISRWIDLEWILAGRRLPLNSDIGEHRVEELLSSLVEYLERGKTPRSNTVFPVTPSEEPLDAN